MILGYYYHVPVKLIGNQVVVESYIGIFLKGLAQKVDKLILFLHEEVDDKKLGYDMVLEDENIELCSLGRKTPAWDRFLFPKKYLLIMAEQIRRCDAVLLRSPSPLSPAIYAKFKNETHCQFLLVGDYLEGMKWLKMIPLYRRIPIQALLFRNDWQLKGQFRGAYAFVNSPEIQERYKAYGLNIERVITSSLTKGDFFMRENTCLEDEINLLYTGRMDLAKGLVEIIEASSILRRKGFNIRTHLVAWEEDNSRPVERRLKSLAKELGIDDFVDFHGKKTIGEELNAMYRMADIYVLPSYFEGFPRTLWEAMANALPIVTTAVGGIPLTLTNRKDALFAQTRNSNDLAQKLLNILNNSELRKTLIKNGYKTASIATVEFQTAKMIKYLNKKLVNQSL